MNWISFLDLGKYEVEMTGIQKDTDNSAISQVVYKSLKKVN